VAVRVQTPAQLAPRWRRDCADPRHHSLNASIWPKPRPLQARARKLAPEAAEKRIAYSVEQARLVAADLGLPLVVRPSY